MLIRLSLRIVLTVSVIAAGIALIIGSGPVNLVTTSVDPRVVTLARNQGIGIIDVHNSHTCLPESPPQPPAPGDWWLAVPVGQPPRLFGEAVVGFNIWRNLQDSCETARKDLYRAVVVYDLTPVTSFKGLITKAELTFDVAVLPVVKVGSPCQAVTGGALDFLRLPVGTAIPAGSFAELTAPFPGGPRIFSIPSPWLPGTLPGGATTQASGTGGATFTVDVSAHLNAVLNGGTTELAFSLTGSDEAPLTVSPPDQFDCRTYYRFKELLVTHT